MSVNVYRNEWRLSNQHFDKFKTSNISAENHNQVYTFGFISPFSPSFHILHYEAETEPQMGYGLSCVFWIIRLESRIL
jgi:hypothetical protein